MARTLGDAFGGRVTTLEEQRAIWSEALHEDAIWEGPMFETPVVFIGREATGRFMEYLLSVVPRFATTPVQMFRTPDPNTIVIERGDFFAANFHAWLRIHSARDFGGKDLTVHGKRMAGGDTRARRDLADQ